MGLSLLDLQRSHMSIYSTCLVQFSSKTVFSLNSSALQFFASKASCDDHFNSSIFQFFKLQGLSAWHTNLLRLLFLSLWTLSTILRTTLSTAGNTGGIKSTTHDVITYTGKVLYTTATHQYDTVLLQVVSLSGDVRVNFLLISQTNTGYLTHSRIRLLRGRCVDADTDTTTLRT